jgi:hypothetical protein
MRSLSLSLAIAAVSLLPAVASAAPATGPVGNTSELLAQYQQPPGWWEQSGRGDEARDRYWRLSPPQRRRYDDLEAWIRQKQAQIESARREQRQLLRWSN